MKLVEKLGLTLPIIQAPMAGSQNSELALAVAKAGGLGSIPCGMLSPDQVVAEIEQFKVHSDGVYNLNFFCHEMPTVSTEVLAQWQACLAPFFSDVDAQPSTEISGLRQPFSHEVADRIEAYKPPVISFHFGLPDSDLLERVKSWGSVILSSATTFEEALWLQERGVDAVIAQGIEAGGHRGMFLSNDLSTQLSTDALLAECIKSLSIPVIAAGGISSAEEIQRMLKSGASAVQLGTLFLLCDEAKTSAVHRQALADPDNTTTVTNLFSGRPARGIRNHLMRSLGDMNSKAPSFPYATPALLPLRQAAEKQGRGDFSPLWSGTNRSGCQALPAAELLEQIRDRLLEG